MEDADIVDAPWRYRGDCSTDRLSELSRNLPFSEVAARVTSEMDLLCCHIGPCRDRAGYQRALFCAEIPQTLFDIVFNSRAGYRGQYFRSPECGIAANQSLIGASAARLLVFRYNAVDRRPNKVFGRVACCALGEDMAGGSIVANV